MKRFTRIFAAALMFMILVTGVFSGFGASAAGTASYLCDLGIDKIKSGQFEFMAYDMTYQKFFALETTSKATWSADWPGHFVPGKDVYTVSKCEIPTGLVDLMCDLDNKWGSAVVFTAPAEGKYNIVVNLEKYSGEDLNGKICYVDVMLVKGGDGTVLSKEEKLGYGVIDWKKFNVPLAANEKVYILVVPNNDSTKASSQNVALNMFLVNEAPQQSTKPSTTKPDTTVPDTTVPEVTEPDLNENNNASDPSGVNPIVIVSIVGGALVLVTVVVVIILNAKNKKK